MTPDQEERIKLDLPANYKFLNVLSGCIAEIMSHVDQIDDHATMVYNIQLATHEVCTNIIGHAYTDRDGARIQIELTLIKQPRRLIIELLDRGRPFDPASVPMPTLDQPQIHGYGLFIIQSLMDEVAYTPHYDSNHWRLVKYL